MAGQPRERGSRAARKGRPVRTPAAVLALNPTTESDPSAPASDDVSPWGRSTELELENRLHKRLEESYAAALAGLADLGYDEDTALRAVLRAGHCYGKLDDPVANIIANASAFLSDPELAGGSGGFADLRRLEEYSLAGLVCLLQSSRPTLSRVEAMWCLLSNDLRLEQAINMGAAFTDKSPTDGLLPAATAPGQSGHCQYHATAATAEPQNHMFDPETFMRLAMRANSDSVAGVSSCVKTTWSRSSIAVPDGQPKQSFAMKVSTEDLIESVAAELESLDIDKKDPPAEKPDPKNEMVRDLIKQTREMEELLKERKEWAQQKAVQAARKLGNDLTELRVLRMEREDSQRRNNDKQATENETSKRLAHLENELKKKSGLLDRSNASVQKLEMENAEIRAEMEAAKLSASETERQCQVLLRKEKKDNKKLDQWERQKAKLHEEITECKAKIAQADKELAGVNKSIKNMEVKIREDAKATEDNLALAEQERGKRESAKADADRRLEEIRRKTEVESQCYKDDLRRLQDELSRLQKSLGANGSMVPSTRSPAMADRNTGRAPKQANQRQPPPASNRLQEPPVQKPGRRRDCVICKKEEACVILLQCAHQVLCVGCNKQHEEKGLVRCPTCNAKIEERIRVFGASSS
ncbi:MND1-interacting protein 1 [Lolium rigidum]|uniref:MND1-interacting protein 1 n=1 Tax=Lolium rigidum TaxID=89674 RepID=UPI001F5C4929|nr:MND1-interacting protein 1 [Lolium rigidum]